MSAPSRPYGVTGSGVVYSGSCTLRGFWITTSGAATVTLYDNTAASGLILAQWIQAAAGTQSLDINDGTRCEVGVYLNVSAGTVTGNVRIG